MSASSGDPASRGRPGKEVQPRDGGIEGLEPADPPESWGPVTRDFLMFEGKLFLDGLLDLVMAPIAALAFLLDLISKDRSGRRFYSALNRGRRAEHWLRLYRPISRAGAPKEKLTDAGLAGADQLIVKIEALLREKDLPEAYRANLRGIADRARAHLRTPEEDFPDEG